MRILIIEDEQESIDPIKACLKAENFAVDVATNGEDGSFMARTNNYDLIISDYLLPKKDGRQICKEVRDDGKNTPIIMLTVKSEIDNKVDLLNIGVDDYVTKPFSLSELMARVNAILRRPHKIKNKILRIADLTLNTTSNIVRRAGKEIYLTRKEFALLEFLMKKQNEVLSRGIIMEHVWDMNADPFSNTIESHILNLRKKIDKGAKRKLIKTIPGRGYKIN